MSFPRLGAAFHTETAQECTYSQLYDVCHARYVVPVGPILAQREAYVDLWCSCQIGDAYIDLPIHLFDTYTYKVNVAPPLNSKLMPRDDRTQSLPYTPPGRYHDRKSKP